MINQKAMKPKLRTLNDPMNPFPASPAQFKFPRIHDVPSRPNITYLTVSKILVLFGLVWCCLVLFGPKILFLFFDTKWRADFMPPGLSSSSVSSLGLDRKDVSAILT